MLYLQTFQVLALTMAKHKKTEGIKVQLNHPSIEDKYLLSFFFFF